MQNNIGDARREYAEKHGKFTQEDAAKYFGVSLSTYKKWEQGQGMMNGSQLRDIAKKYEVTVDYLLGIVPTTEYASVEFPREEWTGAVERELLGYYRSLSNENKAGLLNMARALSLIDEMDK